MSRSTDRPLTDAEERCLIELAARLDRGPAFEWAKPCRSTTTLFGLKDRGLIETRLRDYSLDFVGRITPAGYELVNGMGD